jgi:hypothetical protein
VKIIMDDRRVQAIALPGGLIYVSSGLITAADDEAELAGALAHLMAHTCTHQYVRGMTKEQAAADNAAMNPRGFFDLGNRSVKLPAPLLSPFLKSFPLEFEAEADRHAVRYLQGAGYDPRGLTAFFSRVAVLDKEKPGTVAVAFYSHLQTIARMRQARAALRLVRGSDEYRVNSSEFDSVKARLVGLNDPYPRALAILLTTHHTTIHSGSRVELEMKVMNTSQHSVSYYGDVLSPYEIEVLDSVGKAAPDTETGLKLREMRRNGVARNATGFSYLKAGESITRRCVLNDYYNISRPGTYFVQIHGPEPPYTPSNTLALIVLP